MPDDTQDAVDNLGETTRNQLTSRRGFLAGSAAVGAVGLTGINVVGADDHDDSNDSSDGGSGNNGSGNMEDDTTDLDILNYALTLEHLEATFYVKGLEDFSDDELMHADLGCGICDEQRAKIPNR